MNGFTQADITNMNSANNESLNSRFHGWRQGGGRCVFTATGGSTIAPHGLGLVIPKGSVITRAVYKVLTTFTSSSDAGTIALHCVAANDIVTATAISTGTTWDASIPIITAVTPTISTWLTTTADSEVTATVAVEALTAGKLVVFLEWLYFGDLALT